MIPIDAYQLYTFLVTWKNQLAIEKNCTVVNAIGRRMYFCTNMQSAWGWVAALGNRTKAQQGSTASPFTAQCSLQQPSSTQFMNWMDIGLIGHKWRLRCTNDGKCSWQLATLKCYTRTWNRCVIIVLDRTKLWQMACHHKLDTQGVSCLSCGNFLQDFPSTYRSYQGLRGVTKSKKYERLRKRSGSSPRKSSCEAWVRTAYFVLIEG